MPFPTTPGYAGPRVHAQSGGEQVRRKSILKTASSTSSMRSLSWAPDIPPDKPPTVRVAPENVWAVGLPKCPGDGFVPGYDEGDVTPGRDKALWMVGDHGLQKTVVEGYSWSCECTHGPTHLANETRTVLLPGAAPG